MSDKKEFFSKYIKDEGFAVVRRIPPDKEYIIFYCDTPERADQQVEVLNTVLLHNKFLKTIL